MESGARIIETPGFDTSYWLCRCEGYEVVTGEGRLGVVEWLVFRSRLDRPDALAVRTGHVLHRSVLVAVGEVEHVLPEQGRITLVANSPRGKRARTLRRRLVSSVTTSPSNPPR